MNRYARTTALSITFLLFAATPLFAQVVTLDGSHPADGAEGVPLSASISLRFSTSLDPATLDNIALHHAQRGKIPVQHATDLTNASITLSPRAFLDPGTHYEVRGTAAVKAKDGAALEPFSLSFTTTQHSSETKAALHFEVSTFDNARSTTTILFGPDRRLYAADAFGHLIRWDIDATGRPVNRTVLLDDPSTSRQYIDLEWDPDATAENLVLWASYSERLAEKNARFYFTGTISRIHLADTIEERVVVRGLPHGRERQGGFDTLPHQPNGLAFREGKLYQSVGSTSSSGGPPNWGVAEQPLSACILEIDYQSIGAPLDVHPASGYDPEAPGALVKRYATGVRNAIEVLAHSNGRLYTAVNINDRKGPGDGVPEDPRIPGNQNLLVKDTTPDHESLYILERGRHYGFPNPARGQYVLNGGNPTDGEDPFEIVGYPVGTQPELGYAPHLMYPIWQHGGTSPNGMIEYAPEFTHPLSRYLLVCFYSSSKIAAMKLGEDGLPESIDFLSSPNGKLPFTGPLDITMDPETGILYIADFGKQSLFGMDGSLKLLRPVLKR